MLTKTRIFKQCLRPLLDNSSFMICNYFLWYILLCTSSWLALVIFCWSFSVILSWLYWFRAHDQRTFYSWSMKCLRAWFWSPFMASFMITSFLVQTASAKRLQLSLCSFIEKVINTMAIRRFYKKYFWFMKCNGDYSTFFNFVFLEVLFGTTKSCFISFLCCCTCNENVNFQSHYLIEYRAQRIHVYSKLNWYAELKISKRLFCNAQNISIQFPWVNCWVCNYIFIWLFFHS